MCCHFRGHKDRLTDSQGGGGGAAQYSEQSTLRIGESLKSESPSSQSRRHSDRQRSIPDAATAYSMMPDSAAAAASDSVTSRPDGHVRHRSMSDSRRSPRGEDFIF